MPKKQLILFCSAIVLFLIASQFILKDQEPSLTYEDSEESPTQAPEDLPPQWENVDKEEEITAFYEQEIPMLEKAREQNLTVTHDQDLPFSKERKGNMTITETWYNQDQIFVLYKLDTEAVNLEQPQTPRLVENVFIESLEGDVRNQELHAYSQAGPAVLYDGEIYTYTSFSGITKEKEFEGPEESLITQTVQVEQFNETVLASFHLHLGDGLWKTNEATLPLSYNPEAYDVETYTFNEPEYFEQGDVRYKPLRLENDLRGSRLYLQIESPRPLSNMIDGQLDSDNNETTFTSSFHTIFETEEENVYMTQGAPLTDVPDSIKFSLNKLYVKSEERITFEVDTRDFDESVSTNNQTSTIEMNESLGTYNGADITLEKKRYEYPRNLTWEFTVNPKNTERPYLSHHPYRPIHLKFPGSRVSGVEINGIPESDKGETFLSSSKERLIIHSSQYALGDHMPLTFTLQNLSDALPFHAESSAHR